MFRSQGVLRGAVLDFRSLRGSDQSFRAPKNLQTLVNPRPDPVDVSTTLIPTPPLAKFHFMPKV